MPHLRHSGGLYRLHYVTTRKAGFRCQVSGVRGWGLETEEQVSGVRCQGLGAGDGRAGVRCQVSGAGGSNGDSGVRIQDTERKNRRQK
jgi:hypothetical protein